MTAPRRTMPWRAIGRGVVIVYGITFLSALVFAFHGVTPETDRIAYPLLALLTGGVGVAIALRVTAITRHAHMAMLGVGIWLMNVTSVLIGAQSFTAWLESSLFIFTTIILGRLLLGTNLEPLSSSDLLRAHTMLTRTPTMHVHSIRRPTR